MRGIFGELKIRIAGKCQSEQQLLGICEDVIAFVEQGIGCEAWYLDEVVYLPVHIPIGYYAVQVQSLKAGKGHSVSSGLKGQWVLAGTVSKARAVVKENVKAWSDALPEWDKHFGRLMDHQGEIVGRFSSNLKMESSPKKTPSGYPW